MILMARPTDPARLVVAFWVQGADVGNQLKEFLNFKQRMEEDHDLMRAIAAVLKAEKSKSKAQKPRAQKAPGPSSIDGIEIVEDVAHKKPKARITPIHVEEERSKPKPARAPVPRARVEEEPPMRHAHMETEIPARAPVRPAKARTVARPMPHTCNCPLCPLKKD